MGSGMRCHTDGTKPLNKPLIAGTWYSSYLLNILITKWFRWTAIAKYPSVIGFGRFALIWIPAGYISINDRNTSQVRLRRLVNLFSRYVTKMLECNRCSISIEEYVVA